MNPYLAAFIGNFSVMLLSLLSALLVCPLLEKPFTKHILSLLSMLAVGCLSGDAIFHLIPHAMKLNTPSMSHGNHSTLANASHSSNGTKSTHQDAEGDDLYIMWKGVVVVASLYSFYLLNTITSFLKIPHTHSHGHSHSHTLHTTLVPMTKHDHSKVDITLTDIDPAGSRDEKPSPSSKEKSLTLSSIQKQDTGWISEKCLLLQEEKLSSKKYSTNSVPLGKLTATEDKKRLPNVVWMILLGDVIHNITDGIAVGASFAGSFSGGISTSIAVLCHEIPHEIGDFVILINAGVAPIKALLMTAATYTSAFAGNFIGVALGEELNIVEWIFAITAGMFLYIALVELLPDIIDDVEDDNERNWTSYICQNIGLILGTAIMALIAAYEDSMKQLFS